MSGGENLMVQRYQTKNIQRVGSSGQADASQRFLAAVSYLLFFITGIIFLYIEKKDRYIRFHAYQSTAFFGVLSIVWVLISWFPLLGRFLSALIFFGGLIFWAFLMFKAFLGEKYKLPYFGQWAEKQALR